MSQVPLWDRIALEELVLEAGAKHEPIRGDVQGYLAHKKYPPSLGPP